MKDKAITKRFISIYNELLKDGKINGVADFAKKSKCLQPTVSMVLNGKRQVPLSIITKIQEVFNVDKEYIFNGKEPMFNSEIKGNNNHVNQGTQNFLNEPTVKYLSKLPKDISVTGIDYAAGKPNMYIVPLKAVGGFLSGFSDTTFLNSLQKVYNPEVKGECFHFRIIGNSMVAGNLRESYFPGDIIVCTILENIAWLQKGKVYLFQAKNKIGDDDGLSLKKFGGIEKDHLILQSNNKEYQLYIEIITI